MDKELFEAARDGHVELVRRLLAEGVNTEWKEKVSQGIYIFFLLMMCMNDHMLCCIMMYFYEVVNNPL